MYKIFYITVTCMLLGSFSVSASLLPLSQNKDGEATNYIREWETSRRRMQETVATQSPDAVIALLTEEWKKSFWQSLYDSHFKQVHAELTTIAKQREQREKSRDAFEILCFIEYFDPHQKNQSEATFKSYFINKWVLEKLMSAKLDDMNSVLNDKNFLNNSFLPFIDQKNIEEVIRKLQRRVNVVEWGFSVPLAASISIGAGLGGVISLKECQPHESKVGAFIGGTAGGTFLGALGGMGLAALISLPCEVWEQRGPRFSKKKLTILKKLNDLKKDYDLFEVVLQKKEGNK